jgi:hypothetical protein
MTRQRNDNHSTEFGLWLRGQLPQQKTDVCRIDSSIGFVTTNLDFVWKNYKTDEWMLIEEKRFGHQPKKWQQDIYTHLDLLARNDPKYHGFHLLVFEHTNPEDGRIALNHNGISPQELVKFLRFNK